MLPETDHFYEVHVIKKTAIVFAMVIGLSFPVYALPVHLYGGNFDLPIVDASVPRGALNEAVIEIPDSFTVYDVDVRINITHTLVFDLYLFLRSQDGTRLCLNIYEFNEFLLGENYTNTIFDDEAELSIEEGEPPFTGRFRPHGEEGLQVFDGEDTYGPWVLEIYDMWLFDTGTLDSFELIITVPEPATLLLLSFGGVTLLRKRR